MQRRVRNNAFEGGYGLIEHAGASIGILRDDR